VPLGVQTVLVRGDGPETVGMKPEVAPAAGDIPDRA
jgi:hypothetical protein